MAVLNFGRGERIALLVATGWSVALLVAAMVAPVYSSATVTTARFATATGSATLVQVNGWRVLVVVGIPLVCTLLVGAALWRRAGRPGAGVAAWVVTGLLAGFNVLALASIGIFVVPVTAGLAVACARHQGRVVRAS
jgi:uncharacterized protein involved in response to NO